MKEFIRIQYIMGKITEAEVYSFVPKWITKEEAEEIINSK